MLVRLVAIKFVSYDYIFSSTPSRVRVDIDNFMKITVFYRDSTALIRHRIARRVVRDGADWFLFSCMALPARRDLLTCALLDLVFFR